jgi:hypothetical protein
VGADAQLNSFSGQVKPVVVPHLGLLDQDNWFFANKNHGMRMYIKGLPKTHITDMGTYDKVIGSFYLGAGVEYYQNMIGAAYTAGS